VLVPFAKSHPDLKNSLEHLVFDNGECGLIVCGRIANEVALAEGKKILCIESTKQLRDIAFVQRMFDKVKANFEPLCTQMGIERTIVHLGDINSDTTRSNEPEAYSARIKRWLANPSERNDYWDTWDILLFAMYFCVSIDLWSIVKDKVVVYTRLNGNDDGSIPDGERHLQILAHRNHYTNLNMKQTYYTN